MKNFLDKAPAGDVLEVGVFQGGSLAFLATHFPNRHFYGYDTFEGMPSPNEHDNIHRKGDFKMDFSGVKDSLASLPNITLIKGVFPTSDSVKPKVIMAHVDVDIYVSTKESLLYIAKNLIQSGGRIYCDDAFVSSCQGATKAYKEVCKTLKKPVHKPHAYLDFK